MKYDMSKTRYANGILCERCRYASELRFWSLCPRCGHDSPKNYHAVRMINMRKKHPWWLFFLDADEWFVDTDQSTPTESGDD